MLRQKPVIVIVDPMIGAGTDFAHAEAVAAVSVDVQLDGLPGLAPRIEYGHACISEQWIVGGECDERRASVDRDRTLGHGAVDDAYEVRSCLGIVRGGDIHSRHAPGRESHKAN